MKELVMTKYLEGLKELFDKYGVTQAYSYEPFANTKEDGVVIWAKVGREGENALMEYMDNYINNEEKAWPELRSFCIGIEVPTKRMHLIYENGRFYEQEVIMPTKDRLEDIDEEIVLCIMGIQVGRSIFQIYHAQI